MINRYAIYILVALSSFILFLLGLRLNNDNKVKISLLIFSSIASIMIFEIYLEFSYRIRPTIAKRLDIPFDKRTKVELISNLVKLGRNAYPNIYPYLFIYSNGLSTNEGKIFPLGGISDVTTVLKNELGYYPIIETDEHGFNNPKGLYKKNNLDILLTGDSFTEGCCVKPNENIMAVLRKAGYNTLSIGKGSNGSLIEFAALKEYGVPLKPKSVLWLFYVNDLQNLKEEIKSPILLKYLNESNFSQNLISRQDEIDIVLINYIKESLLKRENKSIIKSRIEKILKLYNLRLLINIEPYYVNPRNPATREEFIIFEKILIKSKELVNQWGGKFYFVYLPDFAKYSFEKDHPVRENVLRIVDKLDIPIIDIHSDAFGLHPDPLSFFPFRIDGHYTVKGYQTVSNVINKKLILDGITPSNLNH